MKNHVMLLLKAKYVKESIRATTKTEYDVLTIEQYAIKSHMLEIEFRENETWKFPQTDNFVRK